MYEFYKFRKGRKQSNLASFLLKTQHVFALLTQWKFLHNNLHKLEGRHCIPPALWISFTSCANLKTVSIFGQ